MFRKYGKKNYIFKVSVEFLVLLLYPNKGVSNYRNKWLYTKRYSETLAITVGASLVWHFDWVYILFNSVRILGSCVFLMIGKVRKIQWLLLEIRTSDYNFIGRILQLAYYKLFVYFYFDYTYNYLIRLNFF